jgi:hypothetical protein
MSEPRLAQQMYSHSFPVHALLSELRLTATHSLQTSSAKVTANGGAYTASLIHPRKKNVTGNKIRRMRWPSEGLFPGNLRFKKTTILLWRRSNLLELHVIEILIFQNRRYECLQHVYIHYTSHTTFGKENDPDIFYRVLMVVYSTQSCWDFGLFPSSGVLGSRNTTFRKLTQSYTSFSIPVPRLCVLYHNLYCRLSSYLPQN